MMTYFFPIVSIYADYCANQANTNLMQVVLSAGLISLLFTNHSGQIVFFIFSPALTANLLILNWQRLFSNM